MTVRPDKIDLRYYEQEGEEPEKEFGEDLFKNTFDPRPHLARYSPNRYWMTASTGPSIVTYVSKPDLDDKHKSNRQA